MTNATDRRRVGFRAHVISPLPLAVGLLATGTGAAAEKVAADGIEAAATSASSSSAAQSASTTPARLRIPHLGYATGVGPHSVANVVACAWFVVDDAYSMSADAQTTGNVRDNDAPDSSGNTRPVLSFTAPLHGALVLNDNTADSLNGEFTYTPDAGYSGTDEFSYTVQTPTPQNCLYINTVAVVTLTVNPLAQADAFSVAENGIVSGNLLGNDVGTGLSIVGNTQPAHGSAQVVSDGTFTYVPNSHFAGTDSFQYTVESGGAAPTGIGSGGSLSGSSGTIQATGSQSVGTVTIFVAADPAIPTPATGAGALGVLGSLLAWMGVRRRRER